MLGKFSVLIASLLLASCATDQPGIEIRTVEVPVVKIEKCIKKEDRPTKVEPLGSLPSNAKDIARLALAKVAELVGYQNQTEILLDNCTKN